ncbi:MAG: phosphoribosylanthranilate isomerase [Gemmatimonadaceae bacterium]
MGADIKFCGLTRAVDAEYAASIGAAYVGVIFAGGPRLQTSESARDVLRNVPRYIQRVGVFADQSTEEIARIATDIELDVVQLHGATDVARIDALRADFTGEIWPVIRAKNGVLPDGTLSLAKAGDGLLLDAFVDGTLGGTGVALPWKQMAPALRALRGEYDTTIVLAGGLTPENVGAAIAALSPDIVDISSGVEHSPGLKDHARMLAFRDAVTHASILT